MTHVQLRLIRGRDTYWALRASRAASLPLEAVEHLRPADHHPMGQDPVRGLALTRSAVDALADLGFFTDGVTDSYAVTVLTATACNLGCNYCFQNTALAEPGSYAPPRIKTAVLSQTEVDATVAFVQRQMLAGNYSGTSVLLFGGEPLLNVQGCVRLLEGLRPLNLVDAEIVTNAVLLREQTALALHRAGLGRVQVTFDGDRSTHDRVRITRGGRPTYDRILRNINASSAAAPDLSWNIRVNVSHRNVTALLPLIEELRPVAGRARRVTLHLALIDDTGLGYDNKVEYGDALARTFIAVNEAAIEAGLLVPPTTPLSTCPYCSVVGGGAGAVVNADGALYSCWENAGRKGWEVGHVGTGYLADETVEQRWVACDFDVKSHGSDDAHLHFVDRVDAAALDTQAELGAIARLAG